MASLRLTCYYIATTATAAAAAAAPSRCGWDEEELVADWFGDCNDRLMTQLLWPWTGLSCVYIQWLDDIYGTGRANRSHLLDI